MASEPPSPSAPPGVDTAVDAEVARSREEFERRLRESEARPAQVAGVWNAAYASLLRDLRGTLQSAGRLREMVLVHDELARHEKDRTLPAPESVKIPPELAGIAALISARMRTDLYAVDREVIEAATRRS